MSTDISSLPAACAAEIAALEPFASHAAAVNTINGERGVPGLRARYMGELNRAAVAQGISDQLVFGIGLQVSLLCDRAIARTAPIGDAEHGPPPGWSPIPLNTLSQAEKENLA